MEVATSANVLLSPESRWTSAMASIIQTDGLGMFSAAGIFFCNSFPSAQERGSKG